MLKAYLTFSKLYKEQKDYVYRYVYMRTRDSELAQDIAADSFLKAYKRFDTFDTDKDFRPWLTTIVRNTMYDHFRSSQVRDTDYIDDKEWDAMASEETSAMELLIEQESWQEVLHLIRELTESQQACILGRFIHYESDKDIAERLDTNEANVRKHISRGIASLKNKLIEQT